MKKMKKLSAVALASVMSASLVMPAFAANYNYIEKLEVSITHNIEAGSDDWEVNVDTNTSNVYIDEDEDITVTNAPEDGEAWGDDIKPVIKIVLRVDTDDNYRFKDIDKDDVTITGDDIYKYTVSDTSKKVTLTVTLPELEYEEGYWDDLLEIEDAEWNDDCGIATWEENENAASYEIKAYRGSTALTSVIKTTETEYNLSQYFTRKGDYTFKVRAVYNTKTKGAWIESDELSVDADEAEEIKDPGAGYTTSSSTTTVTGPTTSTTTSSLPSYVVKGTWGTSNGQWTFKDSNGVAYKNKWAAVYNPYANTAAGQQAFDWFYFDGNGYMVTGWVLDSGRYYYLSPVSDGTQGRMVTGWLQIGSTWYYFNPNSDGTRGAMLTDTWVGSNYVDANGAWIPGKTK